MSVEGVLVISQVRRNSLVDIKVVGVLRTHDPIIYVEKTKTSKVVSEVSGDIVGHKSISSCRPTPEYTTEK